MKSWDCLGDPSNISEEKEKKHLFWLNGDLEEAEKPLGIWNNAWWEELCVVQFVPMVIMVLCLLDMNHNGSKSTHAVALGGYGIATNAVALDGYGIATSNPSQIKIQLKSNPNFKSNTNLNPTTNPTQTQLLPH